MLAHNLFRAALIGIFALLLVRPVSATIEQVLPLSGGRDWVNQFQPSVHYVTPGLACDQMRIIGGFDGTWTQTLQFVSEVLYQCKFSKAGSSTMTYNVNRSGTAAVCPVVEPPYFYNALSGYCEREAPACPAAGTLHSDGYFNVGTVPTGSLLNTACVSSCKIELISGFVPAARQKIEGIYYYFGSAKYNHTGEACTPDTSNFLADFVGNLPSATCGAGQQMISMNGVTKCFDAVGDEISPNSASAVAAIVAQGDAAYAAMMADTASKITAMGGTASDVVAAQTVAAGVFAAGGGSPGGSAVSSDPVMAAFCADNPTASICAEQDFGMVDDVSLTDHTINVSVTPVSVGGVGACPAPSPMVLRGQTYYFVWDTYCNFATGIKPILLAFGWLAAAGILVGGFRS